MDKKKSWKTYKNILCVQLENMGDVLMTTPAIRAIRKNSNAKITLLTSHAGGLIASLIPEVDEAIAFDAPWIKLQQKGNPPIFDLIHTLKLKKFDAAIIFTTYGHSSLPAALLLYLAKVKTVLSYCRENPYNLISDWIPDPDHPKNLRHGVIRQLDLVESRGFNATNKKLSLKLPDGIETKVLQILKKKGVDTSKKFILVHPGASDSKRRYPLQKLIQALQKLIKKDCQILVTGSLQEKSLAESIVKKLGDQSFSFAGDLSISEFAGLISISQLLITNNTSPVHIAAALNTPVIDLYAKTNPQHTPWRVKQRVLYFDVPQQLRSKNTLLQQFEYIGGKQATPETIVESVLEFLS